MAIPNVQGQQYRLDWPSTTDPQAISDKSAELWYDTDQMIQTLFDDLNSTINAINALNIITAPQLAARISLRM